MNDRSQLRLVVLRVLVVSLLLTLFGRAWYLQVLSGEQYARAANDQGTRTSVTPAVRGVVLDAQGRPLITNVSALVVSISRKDLPRNDDAAFAVLGRVGAMIGIPANRLKASIRPCGPDPDRPGQNVPAPCSYDNPFQPVPVATLPDGDDAGLRTAYTIQENPELFPGVSVDRRGVRDFREPGAQPGNKLAAQTLGYVGPINGEDLARHPDYDPRSNIGRGGVEQSYDAALRGTPGRKTVRVDSRGQEIAVTSDTAPVAGPDLVLNLDATLQKAAEDALQKALTTYAPASESGTKPKTGAAVVMTTDGRVVALASAPSYDPSVFFPAISTEEFARLRAPENDQPLTNRAAEGLYAPGSAFKAVSASAMLTEGLVGRGEGLHCPAQLPVGNQVFKNFRESSPGSGDLRAMLEFSCDTIFDKYAYNQWQADGGLRATPGDRAAKPREVFTNTAKAFGFGARTGLDLPGDAAGAVIDRAARVRQAEALKAYNCKRFTQVPEGSDEYKLTKAGCEEGQYLQGGEAAQFAIGQGSTLEVSPLQMARAYAAVANGGTLYDPTLGRALVRPDGTLVQEITPRSRGKVPTSPEDLDYIREGLYRVTHGAKGTAVSTFGDFPVPIAGKTGTAEKQSLVDGVFRFVSDTAWFVSFGPYAPGTGTSAKYVVAVVIPDSGQGGQVAAPAARDIWAAIYGVKNGKVTNPNAGVPAALPCFRPGKVLPDAPGRCGKAPSPVPTGPAAPFAAPSATPSGAAPSGPAARGAGGTPDPQALTPGVPAVVPGSRRPGMP